jgi:Domain of unknown function (DUF6285)
VNDRPAAEELLRAVERFLEREVVPRLEGVPKFHARVAANVVAMVAREIETVDGHERGEWLRLAALLGDDAEAPAEREARRAALVERNEELVRRIRAGEADAGPWRAQLLAHLRRTVAEKLEVARPPRQARG